jgi:predicted ArsR family transcriptional regulator
MASYDLLDAINRKGIRTTADVARVLGVDEREARRQIREAVEVGFVAEEYDESVNVPPDFERAFWHLTKAGNNEWDRLDAERAPGA